MESPLRSAISALLKILAFLEAASRMSSSSNPIGIVYITTYELSDEHVLLTCDEWDNFLSFLTISNRRDLGNNWMSQSKGANRIVENNLTAMVYASTP